MVVMVIAALNLWSSDWFCYLDINFKLCESNICVVIIWSFEGKKMEILDQKIFITCKMFCSNCCVSCLLY